ncbi:MAG TPA: hypothetical protein VLD38_06940 [Nitrosopumilaceae archaeon]|nr:hypothetical protein [Nitrosopumilaceae archaeon]
MSTDLTNGEKSESITFRLDKQVMDKLRSQSKNDGISLNSLVNQLLSHCLDWDVVSAKAGWFPIPKYSFISLLDKLDEKTISEVGEQVGKVISKDMLLKMRGYYNLAGWISVLKSRARAGGFTLTEIEDGDQISFIMQHDMGLKSSIWFKSVYTGVFSDLDPSSKHEYTDNTLVYKVNKKVLVST